LEVGWGSQALLVFQRWLCVGKNQMCLRAAGKIVFRVLAKNKNILC